MTLKHRQERELLCGEVNELAQSVERAAAYGLVVGTPYYNKPAQEQEGLFRHSTRNDHDSKEKQDD